VTGCFIIKVFGAVNNSGSVDANQIVTTLGLQDARISNLESTGKKIYLFAQMTTGGSNPATPNNVIWSTPKASYGGIVYDSTNRWFTIPVAGVYKMTITGLSGGASSNLISLNRNRAGAVLILATAYADVNGATMMAQSVDPLLAGDRIYVNIGGGALFNQTSYNSILIERIDN
jgi:hypothetical protein